MTRNKSARALTAVEAILYMQDVHGITRSPHSLAAYVTRGCGPAFIKIGRSVRYFPSDLDEYVKRITSPRKWSSSKLANHKSKRRMAPNDGAKAS
jgi:hypothetical protein